MGKNISRSSIKKVPGLNPKLDLTNNLISQIQALDCYSVKTEYLKSQFLTKFVSPDTDPPVTRRTRAINKWLATERENEATNDRLLITNEGYNILPRVTFESFVGWCRGAIRDIIGDTPPIDALIGSFSGGASTSRKRNESHPAFKYVGKAHVTLDCLEYLNEVRLFEEMPGWFRASERYVLDVVPGNVLFTVPKNAEIDRCAAKEPDLNMFVQKGIGDHLRKSLRRIGINLNDQSRNRLLARQGSIDGSLATLDLSSASDSVSTGLVSLLLPETWYTLLDSVRSPVTIIDGEEHRNHMFSSMGNGFTFELESLLFYVLARATCYFTGQRGIVSVYGDDIICPTGVAADLIWVLQYFGFQVNPDKSFTSGPFRESCGGHYHNGWDITPFYLRGPIVTMPDLIHVANQLREWAKVRDDFDILDPMVAHIWMWLRRHVPAELRGGVDTAYKYQLVSPDTPSHRLVEEKVRRSTGFGGYLHWLNTTWDRDQATDGIETSRRSVEVGRLRMMPARTSAVRPLRHRFPEEVDFVTALRYMD